LECVTSIEVTYYLFFSVFIGLFLIVHRLLIPASHGQNGYFRAKLLDELAHVKMVHASNEIGIDYHGNIVDSCEGLVSQIDLSQIIDKYLSVTK